MPVPSPRNPIRPARGLKADLVTNIANLYEGEIVFATDEDLLYVRENGQLIALSAGIMAGDPLDTNIQSAQNGEALIYNAGEWSNGGQVDGGNF